MCAEATYTYRQAVNGVLQGTFQTQERNIYKKDQTSVTSKKSPNVYKICPKMIPLETWKILTSLQKLPKNVGNLGKIIVATGFVKLPKVQ